MTSSKRPVIGVTGPIKGDKLFWFFTKFALKMQGAKAVRLSANTPLDLTDYHGFIISGGTDINPELYGEAAVMPAIAYDMARDTLETKIISHSLEHNLPLFGICRGMQMINVAMDGTLYQEASEILEGFLPNKSLFSKFIGRRQITIETTSRLYHIMGDYPKYYVNSIHHQAVNKLGNNLRVSACEKNGLIQAIEHESGKDHSFILGVQWHPELMLHRDSSRRLFKAIVERACKTTAYLGTARL